MPFLSLTLTDSFERVTRRLYEMESQLSIELYTAAIGAFLEDLEDVTDLGVVRVDLILDSIGGEFASQAGSNVDVGATFQGYTVNGNGKKASHKVPGIKLALVDDLGNVPLTGAVSDYLANFEAAGAFNLSDDEHIDSWIKGTLDK